MFIPRLPIPRTLAERFANVILFARHAVAEAQRETGLPAAIAWAIDGYLRRALQRFTRLLERAANGTLTPPRPRKPPAEGVEKPPRKPRERPPLRMSGHGWISYRAIKAVTAGTRLQALLDDPELKALIGLDARFAATLRPLLAALGAVANPGQLPPPPPRVRPPRPAKPPREKPPRKVRATKIRWWCAKPPRAGLIFSDESLN